MEKLALELKDVSKLYDVPQGNIGYVFRFYPRRTFNLGIFAYHKRP